MNLINNKKIPDTITITLTYNNKDLTFTMKRFNKLSKVKEKAFQLFYPIKSDITLKYNNKDLSEFLEQSIGLIFENKTRLKIKIEPQIGTQRLVKKLILKSNKNILYRNSEIDKQALSIENYKSLNTETANKIKYIKKLICLLLKYVEIAQEKRQIIFVESVMHLFAQIVPKKNIKIIQFLKLI